MTYSLSYNWNGSETRSYIGSDDYNLIMDHIKRLTGDPRVSHLEYAVTQKMVLS